MPRGISISLTNGCAFHRFRNSTQKVMTKIKRKKQTNNIEEYKTRISCVSVHTNSSKIDFDKGKNGLSDLGYKKHFPCIYIFKIYIQHICY